jgi:hypothetical protein
VCEPLTLNAPDPPERLPDDVTLESPQLIVAVSDVVVSDAMRSETEISAPFKDKLDEAGIVSAVAVSCGAQYPELQKPFVPHGVPLGSGVDGSQFDSPSMHSRVPA